MALKIYKNIKFNGVQLKTGYFYQFNYRPYEHDANPMIIFISAIKGLHPNTGHQWRLIQGINLNYIPRKVRKQFVNIWKTQIEKGATSEFTWNLVKTRFPYLKDSIRRYNMKPVTYIKNLEEIPFEKIEPEVIRSLVKDFSVTLKRKLGSRIRSFFMKKKRK